MKRREKKREINGNKFSSIIVRGLSDARACARARAYAHVFMRTFALDTRLERAIAR